MVHSLHVWKGLKFNRTSKHVSRLNVNKIANTVKNIKIRAFLRKFKAVETLKTSLLCIDKSEHTMWFIPYSTALSKCVTDRILQIVNQVNVLIHLINFSV